MTWNECHAAGMTLKQAAAAMRRTPSAGSVYAKRHGFKFFVDVIARAERLCKMNAEGGYSRL